MSRIDELIRQHCPNGVQFKLLADVTTRSSNIKWSEAGDEKLRYIDLSSVDRVTRKIGETETISAASAPSRAQQIVREGDVIFATTRPTQMRSAVIPANYNGQIVSTGYCVLRPVQSQVLPNFLAHLLGAERFRRYVQQKQVPGNYPSIPDRLVRAFRIPVPPLDIQREIVRVLDLFQSLEAELEARRRQFAHYRDSLIRFDLAESDVDWVTLPDVAVNLDSQRRPVTKSAREPGPFPYYGASGVVDFVSSYIFDGDYLLISEDGANLLARSSPIAFQTTGKVWVNNHAHVLEFPTYVERRFVEIYLNSIELAPWVSGGAQPKLNQANMNRIPIPHPELAEQQRIVGILDAFDALVFDISAGLPAELAARRKQYEYYRHRLLSFEEVA